MMGEAERRPAKASENVEIGRLRRERKSQRGEGGLAVKSGAPQTRSGQKMRDRFQSCSLPY